MILSGLMLAVVLLASVWVISALGSSDKEEVVMEKFCKLECTSCQRRF